MALQTNFTIILVFYYYSLSLNTCISLNTRDNCNILKVVFQEGFLYSGNSLNLSKADTITIFDKNNFFKRCERKLEFMVDSSIMKHQLVYDSETINNVVNKVVIIKTQDVLPTHLVNGAWTEDKKLLGKYENYFIFNEPQLSGDSLRISLFRLRSNHKIDITYKVNPSNIERLSYSVGQY